MLLPTHATLPDIATSGHPASAIANTPAGNIAATTVQAAINELDSEKIAGAGTVTDNALVRFDGTTGSVLQNSVATLSDNGTLTLTGATVTASDPILNATQTWNNAGVTFVGIKANITDTASAAGSLLLDLRVGNTTVFSVDKTNTVRIGTSSTANIYNATQTTGFRINNNYVDCIGNGTGNLKVSSSQVVLNSTSSLGWTLGNHLQTVDLMLWRDAAGILAQRNGTNAQSFRLYNTFTDGSNYERLALGWGSNVCTLQTESAGTGTLRGLKIGGAVTNPVGFFGATPVVQPASADQAAVTLGNTDNEIGALAFSASPTQAECQALRDKCEELADDVRALSTLVHSLRTALVNLGLAKGAA